MTQDKLMELLRRAYLEGFSRTGEGYNAEYPFYDRELHPTDDAEWVARRDQTLKQIIGGDYD